MMEQEDYEFLIRRESSQENLNTASDSPDVRKENDGKSSTKSDDSVYEKCLSTIGFGKFHYFLLIVCGMANASDAIEILCVSFVMPSAECDLKMSTSDKGFLSSMTFVGMMFGGYIWGAISDVAGRKRILFVCLIFNGLFGSLSGFSQSYHTLLIMRFFSGLGVGGSVPIVWSYFAEFIPKHIRGRLICALASTWLVGNLLVILLAFIILNQKNIDVVIFGGILINSWRWFMVACAQPSFLTAFLLIFLPESPKFCLHNGQEMEAKKILRNIYSFNNKSQNLEDLDRKKRAFELFDEFKSRGRLSLNDDAISQFIYNINVTISRKWFNLEQLKKDTNEIIQKTISLFKPPHAFKTVIILYMMFSLCFGYYGLWMWLPELFKRMSDNGGSPCAVDSKFKVAHNESIKCSIENQVYTSSFWSSLSNLPGNIFTVIFIDKMGRNLVTSLSLIFSGLSVFGIPFIQSVSQGVLLTTIFGGINVITFNSFGCIGTELFPTKLRSTSLGVQFIAGRMGAILGNMIFGLAVDVSCYIPLLSISFLMISAGLVTFKLPEAANADIN